MKTLKSVVVEEQDVERMEAFVDGVSKKISEMSPTESQYLSVCKRELACKIALKGIREEKAELEKELERLDVIGQIKFEW